MAFRQGNYIRAFMAKDVMPAPTDGSDPMLLVGVTGQEAMSEPFCFKVIFYTTDHQFDPRKMIGKHISMNVRSKIDDDGHLSTDDRSGWRCISGIVNVATYAEQHKARPELRVIRLEVVPWLSLLQYNVNCRVFHDLTAIDIIKIVLDNALNSYADHLVDRSTAYDLTKAEMLKPRLQRLDYCTQYNESDYNFIARLMEDHGLYYYFHHYSDKNGKYVHTLKVGADRAGYQASCFDVMEKGGLDGRTHGRLIEWEETMSLRTATVTQTDFNPDQPDTDLTKTLSVEEYIFENDHQIYSFPGRYLTVGDGKLLVPLRKNEQAIQFWKATGTSTLVEMEPGSRFNYKYSKNEYSPRGHGQDEFVITQCGWVVIDPYLKAGAQNDSKEWYEILLSLGKTTVDAIDENQAGNILDQAQKYAKIPGSIPIAGNVLGGLSGAVSGVLAGIPGIIATALSGLVGLISGIKDMLSDKPPVYSNTFSAVPAGSSDIAFCKQRTTPKPIIHGIQSAIVIGPNQETSVPAGTDDLFIDDKGRVRVRFHWFRNPPDSRTPQPQSCFVRVSETWAGSTMGEQFLPRIGHEVLVAFLDGDPDRPIIVGAVYNGKNKQPLELLKYKTRSGLKTRSTPAATGKDKYHMLRFEDKTGSEQVLLRSQRRLDVRAFGSSFHTVGANYHLHVGYKDPESDESGGDLAVYAGGAHDLHVLKSIYAGIDEDWNVTVKGKTVFDFQGGTTLKTPTLDVSAKMIRIESVAQLDLKVGGNFVSITPAGVAINGTMVLINSGGAAASAQDTSVTDPLDAAISDTGEPGMLERLRKPGKGGGRRVRDLKHYSFPNLPRNADGSYQYSTGVRIDGSDPLYVADVAANLDQIAATTEGANMLNNLNGSGKQTLIHPYPATVPPNAFAQPGAGTNQDYADATPSGQPVFDGGGSPINDAAGNQLTGTGRGTDVDVSYNPSDWTGKSMGTNPPGDVILFHEMTHGDHMQQGTYDGSPGPPGFDTNEEKNTIDPENRYRDERGHPRRHDHHDL